MTPFSESKTIEILLKEIPEIELIYLFGSIATGKTHPQSDIDIAYLAASNNTDEKKKFEIQEKLAAIFDIDVDLVDLRAASEVFSYEVVTKGRLIYFHNLELRHSLEDRIWNDYLYLNEVRRHIVNDKFGRQML